MQIADGAGNLRKPDFRNIPGGHTDGVDRFRGIKIQKGCKILAPQIFVCVQAAPRKEDISHAGLQRVPVGNFYIQVVQFFQKAALAGNQQVGKVVRHIVLNSVFGCGEQRRRQVFLAFQFPKAVFKAFDHVRFLSRLHLPKRDGACKPAFVGVGNIKVVFQPVSYTHLDVYKRQACWRSVERGIFSNWLWPMMIPS